MTQQVVLYEHIHLGHSKVMLTKRERRAKTLCRHLFTANVYITQTEKWRVITQIRKRKDDSSECFCFWPFYSAGYENSFYAIMVTLSASSEFSKKSLNLTLCSFFTLSTPIIKAPKSILLQRKKKLQFSSIWHIVYVQRLWGDYFETLLDQFL